MSDATDHLYDLARSLGAHQSRLDDAEKRLDRHDGLHELHAPKSAVTALKTEVASYREDLAKAQSAFDDAKTAAAERQSRREFVRYVLVALITALGAVLVAALK